MYLNKNLKICEHVISFTQKYGCPNKGKSIFNFKWMEKPNLYNRTELLKLKLPAVKKKKNICFYLLQISSGRHMMTSIYF